MSTKTSGSGGWKVMAAIAMTLGAAVTIGVVPKLEQRDARAEVAEQAAGPRRV
ncbi:MAG: hypothetical protein IAG13_02495, partial [Deltaproteobacteria bacterium]|nr:hypothetical protein [Nannocystaceae bacterium]